MTDKEVQKLSKPQLIEILYYLSKANDELKAENQQLKDRLDALVGEAIAVKKESAEQPAAKEEIVTESVVGQESPVAQEIISKPPKSKKKKR